MSDQPPSAERSSATRGVVPGAAGVDRCGQPRHVRVADVPLRRVDLRDHDCTTDSEGAHDTARTGCWSASRPGCGAGYDWRRGTAHDNVANAGVAQYRRSDSRRPRVDHADNGLGKPRPRYQPNRRQPNRHQPSRGQPNRRQPNRRQPNCRAHHRRIQPGAACNGATGIAQVDGCRVGRRGGGDCGPAGAGTLRPCPAKLRHRADRTAGRRHHRRAQRAGGGPVGTRRRHRGRTHHRGWPGRVGADPGPTVAPGAACADVAGTHSRGSRACQRRLGADDGTGAGARSGRTAAAACGADHAATAAAPAASAADAWLLRAQLPRARLTSARLPSARLPRARLPSAGRSQRRGRGRRRPPTGRP